jgi:hypothetical protein
MHGNVPKMTAYASSSKIRDSEKKKLVPVAYQNGEASLSGEVECLWDGSVLRESAEKVPVA